MLTCRVSDAAVLYVAGGIGGFELYECEMGEGDERGRGSTDCLTAERMSSNSWLLASLSWKVRGSRASMRARIGMVRFGRLSDLGGLSRRCGDHGTGGGDHGLRWSEM
jgi:hypothetical protein